MRSNPPPLSFLPINEPKSPPGNRTRRAFQSCDRCRDRKTRCEPSSPPEVGGQLTCRRCQSEKKPCKTTQPRKKRKLRGDNQEATFATTSNGNQESAREADSNVQVYIARSQVPDNESQAEGYQYIQVSNIKDRIMSTHLSNAADALDLLTFAATDEQLNGNSLQSGDQQRYSVQGSSGHGCRDYIATSSSEWTRFCLVKRRIVQEHELIEFLDIYFAHLWPLLPVVPGYFNSRQQYLQLALEEPVLTISLVALTSRYHILSGSNGAIRSERIHWRVWPWAQKYLQSSMWGSSCMRRPGAIAALLLFIEWHCKAVNSPEDFLGNLEDLESYEADVEKPTPESTGPFTQTQGPRQLTTRQRSSMTTLLEKLNIVAPAYRSNKMSWMLLSTAIALAQECCFFDEEFQPETRMSPASLQIKLEWSRILCVFIQLADDHLALRLGLEPLLPQKLRDVVQNRLPRAFDENGIWKSALSLAAHMSRARELLQNEVKGESIVRKHDMVAALELVKLRLDRWKGEKDFITNAGDSSLRNGCIDLEYFYARLYSFSPAAYALTMRHPQVDGRFDPYITTLSQFSQEATKASTNILKLILHGMGPSKHMKYLGVRYWLYIVCASLFLLKATLSGDTNIEESHPNIKLITDTISAMRESAPDDIHMSQRYATFLEICVKASLRSSSRPDFSPQSPSQAHNSLGAVQGENININGVNTYYDFNLDPADEFLFESGLWPTLPSMTGVELI